MIKRNLEIWKPIEGYDLYQISDKGRVKSLKRIVDPGCGRSCYYRPETIMKPGDSKGYKVINLYQNNKSFGIGIHLLVLIHFIGPKPSPIHQGNHKDTNILNNWSTNLEWMTPKENTRHAHALGLCDNSTGSNNVNSKLKKEDVLLIRQMHKTKKYSQNYLSKKFGIAQPNISKIVRNKIWRVLI